ncbi:24908_t:CDS:2 [Gigaspora margarita]|uniref:24908_t:CDS:1 n=1 Tax=Gigaspora margarita TaxID=4874 RepID=A0ABN7ULA5_GIGMA|nr:24908_t:CDS:2 [Gigaspora margarita]
MIAQSIFKELIGVLQLRNLLSGWCIDDNDLIDIENFLHSNCSEIKLRSKWNKHKIKDAGFISADLRTNGLLESVIEAYSSYFLLNQAIIRTNISYHQNVSYFITEPNGNYHYVKFSIGEIVEATLPEKQQSDFGIIKGIIKHTWNNDKNYVFIYLNWLESLEKYDNLLEKAAKLAAAEDSVVTAWTKIHSFSIGLPGSPDLITARSVAEFLSTDHYEYTFTVQEDLNAILDIIHHLETYDVTTIMTSTPMYLLLRKISRMGVKMVLSGEGSDEMLRVPFLDKDFLDVVMMINPEEKMPKEGKIEKLTFNILTTGDTHPYLPDSILWHQKEQFSDSVCYSWIDSLCDISKKSVTDEQLANAFKHWSKDTPQTKEAHWYRNQFESFLGDHCTEVS